jgi:NAD(P)-dependent dehydrogenase (short-subunit alcohol dehydrogenase family)
LANDIANDGITANAVLPGLTNTVATAPQSEEQKRATWNIKPSSGWENLKMSQVPFCF